MQAIAIAGLVIGTVSAVAAIFAAWFAWKAPTKSDLQRVEENTAETSERLDKVRTHIARVDERLHDQHSRDLLIAEAQRVAIAVSGSNEFSDPLKLSFKIKDPKVVLTYIEMLNDVGTLFGSADCEPTEDLSFTAILDNSAVQRWFSSGKPDQAFNRRSLRVRAHMHIAERVVYRDVPISLISGTRPGQPNSGVQVFILEGNC
jgi:hypothetical protein